MISNITTHKESLICVSWLLSLANGESGSGSDHRKFSDFSSSSKPKIEGVIINLDCLWYGMKSYRGFGKFANKRSRCLVAYCYREFFDKLCLMGRSVYGHKNSYFHFKSLLARISNFLGGQYLNYDVKLGINLVCKYISY